MSPTHPKSTLVHLCLVLLMSLGTKSHVSKSFSPLLFAEAARTDKMSEEETARKLEKIRLASEFLDNQKIREAKEAMRSAAEAHEKRMKEEAKRKRRAQQQYTKVREERKRRAEEY